MNLQQKWWEEQEILRKSLINITVVRIDRTENCGLILVCDSGEKFELDSCCTGGIIISRIKENK
jgi:hypothetical protein